MTDTKETLVECILDSSRGQYIPEAFIAMWGDKWISIDPLDKQILLRGPSHKDYWEAWEHVLDNARFFDENGEWQLWQDGDLFMYCGDGEIFQ